MGSIRRTLAGAYAEFARGVSWDTLPGFVREKTLELVADWMANAAAGLSSEMGRGLERICQDPLSGREAQGAELRPGQSLVLGSLSPAQAMNAAMINGGASHALESDDAYRQGLFHPGAPVISAAWAAAGMAEVPGTRFLAAVVAGYEVSMRLAESINPGHNRIFHTTGTMGTIGAALSAGIALNLREDALIHAIGLAGTQASGLWEILPDTPQAKGLHTAKAAYSGLFAARLAGEGIPGPSTILEGEKGVFRAMVPEPVDPASCQAGLGSEWRLALTTVKAYPVCGHTMTPIEAALSLAGGPDHQDLNLSQVAKIEVRAHPVSISVAGYPDPRDGRQARFSIAFCVAAALARGRVTTVEFLEETLSDPLIRSLMEKTRLVPDDSLTHIPGRRPARVTLIFNSGRHLTQTAHVRRGDPENPLTPDELKRKFLSLTAPVWGREAGKKIYRAVRQLPDVGHFRAWQHQIQRLGDQADLQEKRHK